VSFDPATGSTRGASVTVIGGSRPFVAPSPSPDGRWIAFHSLAPQLDIFVSRADGSGIRQLTNDRANDRNPVWSPDGRQIRFMSNRDGKNQIWSISPDGSGLQRLTAAKGGAATYGISTVDGSKMVFDIMSGPPDDKLFVFDPQVSWQDQTPTTFPLNVEPGIEFHAWSWSPDGQQLAGTAVPFNRADPEKGALVIYSFPTSHFTRLYDSHSATSPLWLNDGRRLLFQEKSKVLVVDSRTHAVRELMSIAPDTIDYRWSITRDNRTLYFVRAVEQSDIWMMRLK